MAHLWASLRVVRGFEEVIQAGGENGTRPFFSVFLMYSFVDADILNAPCGLALTLWITVSAVCASSKIYFRQLNIVT